jgi:TraG P-loop domain/TraC protein
MQRSISRPIRLPNTASNARGKARSVVELYPLWDIVEGVALTEDGWCEVGVKLELPSRLFLTEDALLTQHASIKSLLQLGVPVDSRLRVYLSIEPEDAEALERARTPGSSHGLIDRLHAASLELLRTKQARQELKRWNVYATLRVRPPTTFSKDAPPTLLELRRIVEHAHQARATLMNYCQNAALHPEPMGYEAMCALVLNWWNPQRATHPKPRSSQERATLARLGAPPGSLTLRAQLLTTKIDNHHEEYLRFGDVLVSSASLARTPMPLEPGCIRTLCDALGNLLGGGRGFVVLEWTHLDPTKSIMSLESAKDKLHSMSTGTKSVPNPQAAEKLRGVKKTLKHLVESGDHTFATGVSVVFTAHDAREWRARSELIKSTLAAAVAGGNAVVHAYQSLYQVINLAPFNARVGEFRFQSDATFVSTLFPPTAPWSGHAKGVIPVRNRQNGLTWLSLFDGGTNANHFSVLAPTGGGKSFTVMSLFSKLIAQHDPLITIVDRKEDFRNFVELLGGANIPFYPGSGVQLNPMDLSNGEDKPDEAKMAFLVALLAAFVSFSSDTGKARDEYAILLDAITQTYRRKAVAGETPILSDLAQTLQTMGAWADGAALHTDQIVLAKSLASGLRPFLGNSPWGHIVDRHTNVNTDARVIYYDLSGIQESDERMRRIALLIVQDRIWNTAKNHPRTVPKIAFVDEFGSQIQTEHDRKFVSDTLRMARSYNLAFGLATQSVLDLERINGIEEAISHFLIGKLIGGEHVFRDRLKLPPAVIELIAKLRRVTGRGGFQEWLWVTKVNDGDPVGEIIKIEESNLAHAVFSSAPDEIGLRETMRQRHGSLEAGIAAMLAAWKE